MKNNPNHCPSVCLSPRVGWPQSFRRALTLEAGANLGWYASLLLCVPSAPAGKSWAPECEYRIPRFAEAWDPGTHREHCLCYKASAKLRVKKPLKGDSSRVVVGGMGMEMEIGVIGAVISKFYCTHRGENSCEAQGPWALTVTLGEQKDAGQVMF